MTHPPTPFHPAAALSAADHSIGAEHGGLLLVEYGDYECPSCCDAEPVTRHLVETFGSDLRFIYRHFPLVEVHLQAELAAEAAEAAAAQGRFWEMHHLLFTHSPHLKLSALTHYAELIELDMIRFEADMASRIYLQRVQEHRRAGEQLDLRGSPSFFLNGEVIDVSFGLQRLEDAVRAAAGRL